MFKSNARAQRVQIRAFHCAFVPLLQLRFCFTDGLKFFFRRLRHQMVATVNCEVSYHDGVQDCGADKHTSIYQEPRDECHNGQHQRDTRSPGASGSQVRSVQSRFFFFGERYGMPAS